MKLQGRWKEVLAVAVVAAVALVVAFSAMNGARAKGVKPAFYQLYFEPAVRMACGQPFGIESGGKLSPEMSAFLLVERDTLSCDAVTPASLLTTNPPTRGWYHLFLATAGLWKVTGISWLAIDTLAAGMMAVMACFTYGIFRLFMPAPLAAALAIASIIPGRDFLLYLRDFNKAPFILASVFLAALIVSRELTRRALLATMAAAGLIIGVGYGFRPDVLIGLPLLAAAAILFRGPPGLRTAADGILGTVVMVGVFVVTASPIFAAFTNNLGTCHWHFSLLGLSDSHTQMLGLQSGRISWLSHYEDGLAARTVESYAHRAFEMQNIGYCTPAYDLVGKAMYMHNFATFPIDFVARGIAAARQVVAYGVLGLPFVGPLALVGELIGAFRLQIQALWVLAWLAVVFLTMARSVRLGLFTGFTLAYLCAYPAVQFDTRHYFHLAFLAWIPVGLGATALWRIARRLPAAPGAGGAGLSFLVQDILPARDALRRAGAPLGTIVGIAAVLLLVAWLYQRHAESELLDRYRRAPGKDAVVLERVEAKGRERITFQGLDTGPLYIVGGMFRIDFGGPGCAAGAHSFTLATSGPDPNYEYRKDFTVKLPAEGARVIVFAPQYFQRGQVFLDKVWISLPPGDGRCVAGAKWLDAKALPALWVGATVAGDP